MCEQYTINWVKRIIILLPLLRRSPLLLNFYVAPNGQLISHGYIFISSLLLVDIIKCHRLECFKISYRIASTKMANNELLKIRSS